MKNKGITLIALVITIIVLIILAGVSIGLLLGENGIITRARQAEEEYDKAAENEQEGLNSLDEQMNSIIGGTNTVTAEPGTLLAMYLKAQEDNCTNDDGTCTNAEHLHIGDYVDYKNPTTGSYTATAERTGFDNDQIYTVSSTSNQLNWRVMGIDKETGGIKLLAGSPMKTDGEDAPYLYLHSTQGYINGIDILNEVGAMYKNEYATSARSVNADDINELTGVTTEDKIREVNIIAYQGYKNYGETYNYENQYTPESYIEGETTTVTGTINGYRYTVNSRIDENAPSVNISNRIYQMLYENTQKNFSTANNKGKFYLLATNSIVDTATADGQSTDDYAMFGHFIVYTSQENSIVEETVMFCSEDEFNYYYSLPFAGTVRPVVILKPEVKNTEIEKLDDKTEETWSYGMIVPT